MSVVISDIVKEVSSVKGVTNIISVITGSSITNMLPWKAFNPVWFVLTFLGFVVFMFIFGVGIQYFINNLISKWRQHG